MKKKILAVILAVVSVAALAACGSNGAAEQKAADGSAASEKSSSTGADTTIKIGAKSFSESKILGELYALALEDAGYKVEREFEVSDNLIHQAVCDGQIDMYPEYTGTSLLTILDQPMETDPQITYDKVKEMYAEKFNLDVLDMCEASNGNGLTMRADVAEKYGIKSISDLQANADKIRFGGTSDTFEREDGLPGLEQTYGTFHFKSKNTFDNSLKYQAMANDEVDCVPAYTTDAQLSSDEFIELLDHFFIIVFCIHVDWEHSGCISYTKNLLTCHLPVDVSCQCCHECDIFYVLFFIKDALIQVCNAPSERDVILEQIYQYFCCLSCIAVSPCLEWCKKLSFFVKCHISVHHGTESDRSQFLDRYSVFFLYIFCHIAVAVLKTCPDIVQRVCPQSVLITVLPCMASGCDRIVLLIDQYCFNSCRTEFDSKICFSVEINVIRIVVEFYKRLA